VTVLNIKSDYEYRLKLYMKENLRRCRYTSYGSKPCYLSPEPLGICCKVVPRRKRLTIS